MTCLLPISTDIVHILHTHYIHYRHEHSTYRAAGTLQLPPQTYPILEVLGASIGIDIDHAIAGIWEHGLHGNTRIHLNRLFCMVATNSGQHHKQAPSTVSWGTQTLPLRGGYYYHFPPNIDMNFVFQPGMRMLAFHYACHFNNGFDLCAGLNTISERSCDPTVLTSLYTALTHMDQASHLMRVQTQVMQLAAPCIPGSISDLHERSRMHARYQVVSDEIDISGAAARVSDIAELMNLSVYQLSKRFRRDLGISIKQYMSHVITRQAATLLRHSDSSIKDIAAQLNFRDEFTFSRFIKKHLLLSPRRYRQRSDIELI